MSTISASPVTGTGPAPTTVFDEIEAVLGFRPEHSLAVLVRRPRMASAVLRVDLPPSLGSDAARTRGRSGARSGRELEEADHFAHTVTGMVSQLSGARSVELVMYHDHAYRPLGQFVYDVAERMHAAGFPLGGVYRVRGGYWSHLVAANTLGGRQFVSCGERTRLRSAPVVSAGSRSATSRPGGSGGSGGPGGSDGSRDHDAHHGPFVPVVRPTQRRLARAMATVAALERRQTGPERDLVDELLEWQSVLASEAAFASDARAIALAWSLRTTSVRDCVLMLCAWGFEAAIVSALDVGQHGAADAPDDLLETVLGTGSRAPAAEQLRRSIDVLRSVAERVPDSLAAPVLSMLAWLEWCRGRGSAAAGYLDAATSADDGYQLAQLLRQMMRSGRLPEWIA
ncbi:MAG: DUF4192 family protein [Herbiconiux sp.]|uniref:DUF4192 family protein n=1 Tax=Herbiconiux sp. TaxID=1871186 RepID=UPI0011FE09FB|nr:DUF4192 family protein [Herbiconiux sp.]TAJ46759.1 MAG: DUF4192 family protein [Herbiconiux sp.]